jgi:hypothetical protein
MTSRIWLPENMEKCIVESLHVRVIQHKTGVFDGFTSKYKFGPAGVFGKGTQVFIEPLHVKSRSKVKGHPRDRRGIDKALSYSRF